MITSLKKISEVLNLDLKNLVEDSFADFPFLVSENFLSRIKSGDKKDPLLLQVLPSEQENKNIPGFNKDPLKEKKCSPVSGLIHKYSSQVLLLVTDLCAVNCRFCFRRYLREKSFDFKKALSYIKNDPAINEVILSGGDPLMLESKKLKDILDRLGAINHIKRIRIHSRIPIVMPEHVSVKSMQAKKPIILVVHCNHPNEINDDVVKKLNLIREQDIIILNQSVLLKNINDDVGVLVSLSERLFDAGVLPYYLHILDKVKGSAHFYVNPEKAQKLHIKMQEMLSGYLVPRLVVEMKNRKKYV